MAKTLRQDLDALLRMHGITAYQVRAELMGDLLPRIEAAAVEIAGRATFATAPQSANSRPVTAEELFGDVPSSLQTKGRQKYVFAPELLDDPEAFAKAQSIANARNYKVRKHMPLTTEEDTLGLIANSFVNQARTKRRRKAASQPTSR
jgi:hypothetical protein